MKKTQAQRAQVIYDKLKELNPSLCVLNAQLQQILDEAQNLPIAGGCSDDTITGSQYALLREIEQALTQYTWWFTGVDTPSKTERRQ